MKVRIGVGAGGSPLDAAALSEIVDGLDACGLDSLWLSEVLDRAGARPDRRTVVGERRSPRLKLGTTILLPGRNLVRFAKQLANLDRLSDGRLLVTVVPGLSLRPERAAMGVLSADRGGIIDEAMPILRRLWAGETVSYHGVAGDFDDVSLTPAGLPVQQPLEMWLGGIAPAALDRCGRLGDGWLPAMCTPGRGCRRAGSSSTKRRRAPGAPSARSISASASGTRTSRCPMRRSRRSAQRSRGHDPHDLVPIGMPALRASIERFLDAGFSKFVVRPLAPPGSWTEELEVLTNAVGDLQT